MNDMSISMINRTNKTLIMIAIIIISIKIYLSSNFHTPFIFSDEYLYSSYAKDILSDPFHIIKADEFQIYPSGYPLSIIPSFIFYPNVDMIYRYILIINCIFTTSILLISYVILKKFVAKDLACFGSILIALLPVSTLYSFMILSENLYIPIYLFSGYLIIKSFDDNNLLSHIFTGFIIFYLTMIRGFGILAYVSFFVVMFYKLFIEKDRINFLINKRYLICVPIILFCTFNILKKTYGSNLYGYDSNMYIQNIIYVFSDIQNFILFSKLIINELDYLILTSYFIFFILSILILLYWKRLDQSTKIYILYSSVYAVLSIFLACLHMIRVIKNPDDPQYMNYFIWGRYIDPILPTIFIIGLISWNLFILNRNKNSDISTNKLIFITVSIVLMFTTTYPYYAGYKIINVMSIYYMKDILNAWYYNLYILPIMLLVPSLILLKRPKTLMTILIIFSLIISTYPYEWLKLASDESEHMSNTGKLLYQNNESILIDKENFVGTDFNNYYLVKFWTMTNKVYESSTMNLTENTKYIFTGKLLPLEILSVSPDNKIMLYKHDIVRNIQMVPIKGFHRFQYHINNISDVWIENDATLYAYNPYRNLTNISLVFETKSVYNPRNINIYTNDELIYSRQIPINLVDVKINLKLDHGDNIIRFHIPNGCERPSDIIGSSDTRCLSLYFQYISLK